MFLLIDSSVFVGFPVKVNGDAGDGEQWSAKIDQPGGQVSVASPAADPTGQGEISIEPGTKQTATVYLDPELQVRTGFNCRAWFDLQAGAIGVGGEKPETLHQLLLAAQGEGDHRTAVSDEEIGLSLNKLPRLVFPEWYKAMGQQILANHRHSVERRRRSGEKGKKIPVVIGCIHSRLYKIWGS